jgi:hypothetical protein
VTFLDRARLFALAGAAVVFALGAQSASADSTFTASKYTAWTYGAQNTTVTFHTNGGKASCETAEFGGVMTEDSPELGLHPEFKGKCSAFGIAGATIKTDGCGFTYNAGPEVAAGIWEGTVDVDCTSGSAIKIAAGNCEVEITKQDGISSVEYQNVSWHVLIENSASDLTYTVTKDGFLCPLKGLGKFTDGELTGSALINATDSVYKLLHLDIVELF